jgi:hypothetical protein
VDVIAIQFFKKKTLINLAHSIYVLVFVSVQQALACLVLGFG